MAPYIPPHLRKKSESEAKPDPPPKPPVPTRLNWRLDEINEYFWPSKEQEEGTGGLGVHFEDQGRTLHGSAETPGELAYLILFTNANPKWETNNIIFTKSRLDLLPQQLADNNAGEVSAGAVSESDHVNGNLKADASDDTSNQLSHQRPSRPIAVFKQMSGKRNTTGYQFEGWYKLERVAFLEPHSAELIRMLEQKWSRTDKTGKTVMIDRNGTEWQKSLSYKWAVVKLAKDEEADKEKGTPDIERFPDPEPAGAGAGRKSVNEMLAEMRLKDSDAGASATGD